MATDYNKLKVTELKEILKERGIPQTGLSRKQQIVVALEQHDAEQGAEDDAADEERGERVLGTEGEGTTAGGENGVGVGPADEADDAPAAGPPRAAAATEAEESQTQQHHPAQAAHHTEAMMPDSALEGDALHTEQASDALLASDAHAGRIVLEGNQPVSKEPSALNTPNRASPAAESTSSDTRKRKRRSPTPPLSQESVNKKLKAADDVPMVTLPEDRSVETAPIAVERTADAASDDGKALSLANNDDVMQVDDAQAAAAEGEDPDAHPKSSEPARSSPVSDERMEDVVADDAAPIKPAIHPATRALYIRDLVRPLQANQLRSHLLNLATPPNHPSEDSIIETLHLDAIRTHAFVVFTSVSAAARTRSALHARIWPDEPTRKPLWVDFVPDEKVAQWIETEKQAEEGKGRAEVRRWEVIFADDENGIEATLQEISSVPPAPARQQSTTSTSGQGMGMPNAPLGPRGGPARGPPSPDQTKKPPPTPGNAPSSASFDVLDERFRHTSTKPKLYYLPASAALVAKREESLAALTSRDWNPESEGSFTGNGDVRRYTFEDGERVVDGGPDIGNFGRPRGMEVGPRSGRGGYRGGRR